ncbi:MAG: YchF/TatD family DNA exonuclease [Deltaproteobacteria bacterium]|nr:YchF/TatD family DNA exonuclease [Deltaproteobacteria bacterium]
MTKAHLIDSHAHLEMKPFRGDLESVLERAHGAGVVHIIIVGSTVAESRRAFKLAEHYSEISAVVGIHPHDALDADDEAMMELSKIAHRGQVVGIGETGLDFFRDRAPRNLQEDAFRKHLDMAKEVDLPVVIHIRDAYRRSREILMEEGLPPKGGVIHCFSGTAEDAAAYLELGLHLSFTGTITFPSRRSREWAEEILTLVPLEKIFVETDSPYLPPHPYRGKRNEPANVALVAEKIAEVKGLTLDDVARITTRNAVRFFDLPVTLPGSRFAYTIRDSVYLNITGKCTSACIFCRRSTDPIVKGHDLMLESDPSVGEMLAALEDRNWAERSEVVFCGYGEPTIRLDEMREVARRIRQEGARHIRLNTNGLGSLYHGRDITPDISRMVDEVSVSLNAQDAGTFERLCRPGFGGGSYEAVKDFARSCLAAGMDVVLTVVDHPDVDIDACRAIAVEMGARFRVRSLNELG